MSSNSNGTHYRYRNYYADRPRLPRTIKIHPKLMARLIRRAWLERRSPN